MTKRFCLTLLLGMVACTGDLGDRGTDNIVDPDKDPTEFACDPKATALTPSAIRRLPKLHFENSLRELFSSLDAAQLDALMSDLATRIDLIPSDVASGFSTQDARISQDHVDAIIGVAMTAAAKIADGSQSYTDALVVPCGPGSTRDKLADDACLTAVVQHYARKALRRPPTQQEVDDFKAFYHTAQSQSVDGLAMLMGRFVGHPDFYYRLDRSGRLVSGSEGADAVVELDKWELLSKVTFTFWDGPPTDDLYDRVQDVDITEDAALSALVDHVLADPRTERGVLRFYREWLQLEKTKMPATEGNTVAGQSLLQAAGITGGLPATHREDMIQEVLDLAKHYTLTTEGTLSDIFTSPYGFARTSALAAIYGTAPWSGDPDQLVVLPPGERSGLLTRVAFVASNSEYTNPIHKGVMLRQNLLCQDVPPPPPELEIKPLTHEGGLNTRQAVETATADPLCQACHSLINPFGFASEHYDPIGRPRTSELLFATGKNQVTADLSIDTRATITIDDQAHEVADAREMSQVFADADTPKACMVVKVFEFASGRLPNPVTDGCDLVSMRERLTEADGSILAMLRETVLQPSFRQRLLK